MSSFRKRRKVRRKQGAASAETSNSIADAELHATSATRIARMSPFRVIGKRIARVRWNSWAFVAPALLLMALFLVYPAIASLVRSFFGRGRELFGPTTEYVGLKNWIYVFTNSTMLMALRNSALWVAIFSVFTVGIGTLLAVLLDRVKYERIVKSVIFIPTAISAVGISIIWKFIFAYRAPGMNQIGLLNAIVVHFGGQPIGWLIQRPWINNLCLIAVGVWMWTGFCMIIISAAYKNIPRPLLEAARIDGAGEWKVFRHVTLPLLAPTAAVVGTTMIVQVLKMFEIVYVLTNGNYSTEVIANRMYKEAFNLGNYGRASTIAVVLLILILPFMILNIRRFIANEGGRA